MQGGSEKGAAGREIGRGEEGPEGEQSERTWVGGRKR